MKKLNYLLLAIAGTLTLSFASAKSTDVIINVDKEAGQIVSVNYDGSTTNIQSMKITDNSGTVLFNFQNPSRSQSYDFSKVPDGNYFINVEDDKSISTTLVTKKDGAITINKDYRFVLKPVFKRDGNKLAVYLLNTNRTPVEIDVYDANRNVVYSYTTDEALVQKQFNFANSPYGTYTVNVSTADSEGNYSAEVDNRN